MLNDNELLRIHFKIIYPFQTTSNFDNGNFYDEIHSIFLAILGLLVQVAILLALLFALWLLASAAQNFTIPAVVLGIGQGTMKKQNHWDPFGFWDASLLVALIP